MEAPDPLAGAGNADAVFAVGVRTVPYVGDHRVLDTIVLPGSFYIDWALSAHANRFGVSSATIRNAIFQTPIMLGDAGTHVAVAVTDRGSFVEYVFYEQAANTAVSGVPHRFAARLEIHPLMRTSPDTQSGSTSIDAFQTAATDVIDATPLYEALHANGNQYGPCFQHVSSVWRNRDRALAEIRVPPHDTASDARSWRPLLIDAAIQSLTAFTVNLGQTFVLHGIERLDVLERRYADRVWAHAEWSPSAGSQADDAVGHVQIVDADGAECFALYGVRLAFLGRESLVAPRPSPMVRVAATFTAEPVADSLNFWADQFGMPIDLAFSPHNQVFQQLLDPASDFHHNHEGMNVILLGLESLVANRSSLVRVSHERAEQHFGDRARYVLPNGLDIVHLRTYETDYLYNEIFEEQSYTRHGICLGDDATVVDIGANIGLFSLFVLNNCARPRVLAFEPSRVVYDLLRANCEAYGSNVQVFNMGVGATPGSATFTYYENSSVFSGFHADLAEDGEAVHAVVGNALSSQTSLAPDDADAYVSELIADRLRATIYDCRMTSVSDIIRDNNIARIDLLKIDAEKSELDILAGIDGDDWPRIQQIVIEVHDRTRQKVRDVERLLNAQGYDCVVEEAPSLAQSGLFTLYGTRSARDEIGGLAAFNNHGLRVGNNAVRQVDELADAVRSFMRRSKVPLLLCFCPAGPASQDDPAAKAAHDTAEERLAALVAHIPHVHTIRSASLVGRYQLDQYTDPHGNHLGHMPYTSEGYAAIGTAVYRMLFTLKQHPYKVIVLDCDNTLWRGVCGEDGPSGIEIPPPHRALQEFMAGQVAAGRLLCLCSKNNERDVLDVFEQRTDMVLKEEHFISRRINWNSKSDNIRSLSRELNLGLDSFIFVDDDAVECADVEINCPGVLALRLPEHVDAIPAFLDRIWAFDHSRSTDEDRERTRLYRQNLERETSGRDVSLSDFIKGLELHIAIAPPAAADVDRVSQLTFRTNQFNFTSIRRSEIEVRDFLAGHAARGLVVRVSDRFGDYGLVGVVLFEIGTDRCIVDTFLLSCRALGKGVEHEIVAAIGQHAAADGKALVEFRYVQTPKNAPAHEFLRSIAHLRQEPSAAPWVFAATDLARLTYQPPDVSSRDLRPTGGPPEAQFAPSPSMSRLAHLTARMQHLGTDALSDIRSIAKRVDDHRFLKRSAEPPSLASGATLETSLVNIWQRVLAERRIGMSDNFFDVGGTSINAVQVLTTIKRELKYELSITDLFDSPTVTLLAAKCRAASELSPGQIASDGAALRGQQRRNRTVKRRMS